ncbi:hypothetical protein [Methylobacillus sp.]|uniref:hypothetical protein n=1 Tax=Methylobacillus sp. TaxID=56818 RepID=UPI002FE24EB4
MKNLDTSVAKIHNWADAIAAYILDYDKSASKLYTWDSPRVKAVLYAGVLHIPASLLEGNLSPISGEELSRLLHQGLLNASVPFKLDTTIRAVYQLDISMNQELVNKLTLGLVFNQRSRDQGKAMVTSVR